MISSRIPDYKMRRKAPLFKDRLILGLDRSHTPIGNDRIARAISKDMLEGAGIDTSKYKAGTH